jgi:hypothetical protein
MLLLGNFWRALRTLAHAHCTKDSDFLDFVCYIFVFVIQPGGHI